MSGDGLTLISGGVPQLLFNGVVPAGGFEVSNIDPVEELWLSDTTTATIGGQGCYRLPGGGYIYKTPFGYKPLGPVSVVAATTGHQITARRWTESSLDWMCDAASTTEVVSPGNVQLRYVIACFVPGKLLASQHLLMHQFSKAVTFPAGLAEYLGYASKARGGLAATLDVVVDVMRAHEATPGVFESVGTITFFGGAFLGTLTTIASAPLGFAQGDTLALIGPAIPDATFGDFTATLAGFET